MGFKKLRLTDLHQAAEAIEAGYEVEIYLVLSDSPVKKPKRKRRCLREPKLSRDTLLRISLEGSPPQKGILAKAWKATRKELWGDDVSRDVKLSEFQASLDRQGAHKSAASDLYYKYGVVRRV